MLVCLDCFHLCIFNVIKWYLATWTVSSDSDTIHAGTSTVSLFQQDNAKVTQLCFIEKQNITITMVLSLPRLQFYWTTVEWARTMYFSKAKSTKYYAQTLTAAPPEENNFPQDLIRKLVNSMRIADARNASKHMVDTHNIEGKWHILHYNLLWSTSLHHNHALCYVYEGCHSSR